MHATGRIALLITLGALLAALLPGTCAADCASLMECCRRAPASDPVVGSASCCKAGQPEMSGPSTVAADVRIKPAREAGSSAPLVVHAPAAAGLVTASLARAERSQAHRAPDVPLYLMNAAVLC